MKKVTQEYTGKSIKELEKERVSIADEIAKFRLEAKTNPQKDSNIIPKRIHKLAVISTIITEKRLVEKAK